jgi:predicted permease
MGSGIPRDPFALRAALALVRACAFLLPRAQRDEWLQEWEAELVHWSARGGRRHGFELVRRASGALPDAAWMRRQLTADADLVHDLRYAFRLVRRTPGASLVALAVFALGIGATTAVLSVADALLVRRLPVPDAERVMTLWQTSPQSITGRDDVSPGNALDWIARNRSFEAMAAVAPWSVDYTGGPEPQVMMAAQVTEDFFRVLRVQPIAGRTFTLDEFKKGAPPVAVLSYGLWRRHFGGDAAIVGRAIELDGVPTTVVGVLPPIELRLLSSQGAERGLWLPHVREDYEWRIRSAGGGYWNTVGRLKDGVTIDEARAELRAISAQLAVEYPRTNALVSAVVVPLREHMAGSLRPVLPLLVGASALVLLVACANIANLVLARGLARGRELVMRRALGAGQGRLVRQLLAETLLMALGGGALGLLLARWGLAVIAWLKPADVAGLEQLTIDLRAAAIAAGVSLLAAIVAGLVPALHLARADATGDGPSVMRAGPRFSAPRRRVTTVLVVAELAFAVMLLVAGGLLLRSFVSLYRVHPGFAPERVHALQVFVWDRQRSNDARRQFFEQVQEKMRAVPGVAYVGAVSAMPFIEANINIEAPFRVQGRTSLPDAEAPMTFATVVAGDYFRAMSIPLIRGRLFDSGDREGPRMAFVISEALARKYWAGRDPVGALVDVTFSGRPVKGEVVGVVGEVRHEALDRPTRPELFMHHPQVPYGSMTFVVRSAPGAAVTLASLKQQVWAIDPQQPLYRIATLSELIDRTLVGRRFSLVLLASFAAVAMLLAVVGLYAVMSFTTAQRTREFGVRLALGATPCELARAVLSDGLRLAVFGIVAGLAGALAATRALGSMLYGVSPYDPATLATASVVLLALAGLSCWVPARRTIHADPVKSLRADA